MASFELPLYGPVGRELSALVGGPEPPGWVARLFLSYGAHPSDSRPSIAVEALGEALGRRLTSLALVLRKAEGRGWSVELRGDGVRITSGLAPETARQAMEADGIWHLAQRLAGRRGLDLFIHQ